MAFKVELSKQALTDFERLMNWSLDNHDFGSRNFGSALLNHVDLLKEFPFMGMPIKGKGLIKIRRLLHYPLYVYYGVDEERGRIEILRFWHTSRRPPKL